MLPLSVAHDQFRSLLPYFGLMTQPTLLAGSNSMPNTASCCIHHLALGDSIISPFEITTSPD